MRLAIIGSRTFHDYHLARRTYVKFFMGSVSEFISGGAGGADKVAERIAGNLEIPITVHRPDWSIGKHAGFLRNKQIIDDCDMVLAFWDGKSKGTKHSIDLAKEQKKPTLIIYF